MQSSMARSSRKLVVCYVPGLDRRSVSNATTPAIAKLIDRYSAVEVRTIPDTELVPTLLCGVYPHQNRLWQVSIEGAGQSTATQRIIDALPDLITTTAQCIRQKFDPDFDLAAIPPRRRRHFTQHRLKYTRRAATPDMLAEFNGYQTVFGVLGKDARYHFTYRFGALAGIGREMLESPLSLEFLEMYALDLFQHWHLDDAPAMREVLRRTDEFVAGLRDGCARKGHALLLLSDHGQEPVIGTIPLVRVLRNSSAPGSEYHYFCSLASTRFWFRTQRAREVVVSELRQLPHCSLLHFSEMHRYDVRFDDARYGEYYLMADAGFIYFPHDFYQPLANFYFGLVGHGQRPRLFNPVHRGNHGYLPHYPSEKGFLVLADEERGPKGDSMSLIDFAPTVLTYLGAAVPAHMTGRSVV